MTTDPKRLLRAEIESIHSAIGERGLLNLTAKIQTHCRNALDALEALSQPHAEAVNVKSHLTNCDDAELATALKRCGLALEQIHNSDGEDVHALQLIALSALEETEPTFTALYATPLAAQPQEGDQKETPLTKDNHPEQSAHVPSVRPCTCHPDDNPPQPCPQKYALSHCRRAVQFLYWLERLQEWRDQDHQDVLALPRSHVIEIIEGAKEYTGGKPLRANADTRTRGESKTYVQRLVDDPDSASGKSLRPVEVTPQQPEAGVVAWEYFVQGDRYQVIRIPRGSNFIGDQVTVAECAIGENAMQIAQLVQKVLTDELAALAVSPTPASGMVMVPTRDSVIEECAKVAESERFAKLQSVSTTKGPQWTEETGNAALMNSHARRIASAIRSLSPLVRGE